MSFYTEIKPLISNSIAYWEKMRIIYNLVLLMIVAFNFINRFYIFSDHPNEKVHAINQAEYIFTCFAMGIFANILFSSAYPIDIFFQHSNNPSLIKIYRRIIFISGLLFSCALAYSLSKSLMLGVV